jgi:hypothetical protein
MNPVPPLRSANDDVRQKYTVSGILESVMDDERKERQVAVRLPKRHIDALQLAAKDDRRPISDWLRLASEEKLVKLGYLTDESTPKKAARKQKRKRQ